MGRLIIADERISKQIESFYGTSEWQAGLVIGNLGSQRSYAMHLCKTPKPDEQLDADDPENVAQMKAKSNTDQKLEDIDEKWVANHAKQVVRMLPGGLDVIGIFALGAPDAMKSAQAKLRQLVYAVHKALARLSAAEPVVENINDRILLQICSVTRKVACRTFDVTDFKSTTSPADWKSQNVLDRLVSLSSQLVVEETMAISDQGLSHTLHKQMLGGLNPVIADIASAKYTVNGQCLKDRELLCKEEKSNVKKKSSKADRDISQSREFRIDLLMQSSHREFRETATQNCGAKMLLRGTVKAKAYVSHKASVAEAVAAVKSDIIRSLISRCILLCEDVEATEEDQDQKILYETPRRITGKIPNTGVELCDYMFPEETVDDALNRFLELIDLSVDKEDINLEFESLPEDEELEKPKDLDFDDDIKGARLEVSASRKANVNNIMFMLGGIIAALVALLVYLLLNQ